MAVIHKACFSGSHLDINFISIIIKNEGGGIPNPIVGGHKIIFRAIILSLIIFNSACNSVDEISIKDPSKEGVFAIGTVVGTEVHNDSNNKTTLMFTAQVFNNDNIGGYVTYWKFIVKKDGEALLEINKDNYYSSPYNLSAYSMSGNFSIPVNSSMILTVKNDPWEEIPDLFEDVVPNNLDFIVTIEDFNDNEQSLAGNGTFTIIHR